MNIRQNLCAFHRMYVYVCMYVFMACLAMLGCAVSRAGASAVLLGRPVFFSLAVAGQEGVSRMLSILRDELEAAMALCGCKVKASCFAIPRTSDATLADMPSASCDAISIVSVCTLRRTSGKFLKTSFLVALARVRATTDHACKEFGRSSTAGDPFYTSVRGCCGCSLEMLARVGDTDGLVFSCIRAEAGSASWHSQAHSVGEIC